MKIIVSVILLIYGLVMLLMCCIAIFPKEKKLKNKVHFYVARDKDGELYLYMGKPIRISDEFITCYGGNIIEEAKGFLNYGLNENDYANLKWEDEPVEVFVNIED